jgi:hypothetical protein
VAHSELTGSADNEGPDVPHPWGCVNTPDMVNNLDDAVSGMKLPKDY